MVSRQDDGRAIGRFAARLETRNGKSRRSENAQQITTAELQVAIVCSHKPASVSLAACYHLPQMAGTDLPTRSIHQLGVTGAAAACG